MNEIKINLNVSVNYFNENRNGLFNMFTQLLENNSIIQESDTRTSEQLLIMQITKRLKNISFNRHIISFSIKIKS